ncbi:hypothetical protein OKW41_009141 [Paraburkholderia sp. UCT70]
MDERKRDSIVAYLRRRIKAPGIKPDDLTPAIASDPGPDPVQHADPDAVSLLRAELVKLLPAVPGRIRLPPTLKGRELLRRFGLFTVASGCGDASASDAFEGY